MKIDPPKPAPFLVSSVTAASLPGSCLSFSGAESTNATTQPSANASRRAQSRSPKPDVKYPHGPDSQRKEGVPRGKVTDYDWKGSKVFTNTIRHYSIYVTAQYDPAKPAALMVFQDGHDRRPSLLGGTYANLAMSAQKSWRR